MYNKINIGIAGCISIFLSSCITFKLNDKSMESKSGIGISNGDMLIALPTQGEGLDRGDVVIAKVLVDQTNNLYKTLIKRIVGLPKDTVVIMDGKIWINGNALNGQEWSDSLVYVAIGKKQDSANSQGNPGSPTVLKAREYFILGDNSMESFDSRNFGGIPAESISELVVFRYWPPTKIGKVR